MERECPVEMWYTCLENTSTTTQHVSLIWGIMLQTLKVAGSITNEVARKNVGKKARARERGVPESVQTLRCGHSDSP
jgi:hypothetical protein